MSRCISILLFVLFYYNAFSQSERNVDFGETMIREAKNTFCQKDTVATQSILQSYVKKYPDNYVTIKALCILGDFFAAQKNNQKAIDCYTKCLQIQSHDFPVDIFKRECENDVFLQTDNEDWGGNRPFHKACVGLSKLYAAQGKYDIAAAYLDSTGNKYNPYQSCGNGFQGYRTYLSMKYADLYTLQGDTATAIQCLLEYFLNVDGPCYDVAKKLKPLLLRKHFQSEINREVINSSC